MMFLSFAEIGQFALGLLVLLAMAGSLPLCKATLIDSFAWQSFSRRAAVLMGGLTLLCFACLIHAFVISDFSLMVVLQNSHTQQPLLYKIAGSWGQHEGSLLLWILILTLCAAVIARWPGRLTPARQASVLGVLSVLTLGFAALSYFTSSPFARVAQPPIEGGELNPLLQDPGLALHPPLLYLGYVGFSVSFAFAFAALREGRFDRAWAQALQPWALFAWTALTAGLALGAWWAYYELGWGGWWFWDPVENAALLPWLAGTALLHSIRVVIARETLHRWTLLLALITFTLSLLGTFLVRSGVLTSVHAFASDPLRGYFILGLLLFYTGGAFALYGWRLPKLPSENQLPLVSRGGALLLNNILLSVAAGTVLLGTLYPLIIDALQLPPITVGAPYFNAVFIPLMLPLLFVLPFGIFLPWQPQVSAFAVRLFWMLLAMVLLACGIYLYSLGYHGVMALLGFAAGLWMVIGATADIYRHWKALDRSVLWPRWLGHLGLGIAVLGMASTPLMSETILKAQVGQSFSHAGYQFRLAALDEIQGANFISRRATVDVWNDSTSLRLQPEKRSYPASGMVTTEAAIRSFATGDLFVTLGDSLPDGSVTLRVRFNPMMIWIWIGAAVMALGGIIGLVRRHR